MINYFAVFDLPLSLTVDAAGIEKAWLDATKSAHPDRRSASSDGDEAANLNQARSVLLDPVSRLEHWLTIQLGDFEPNRSIDTGLMDLFASVNAAIEAADSVISRLGQCTTALAKAMLAKEAVAAQLGIQARMQTINSQKTALVEQFGDLEESAKVDEFDDAKRILGQLKFLSKWEQQCQARLLSLLDT